ncbi:extracellular solute-binding protein [Ruegeria sp.]|uniref:extracellular solute-binding protein n=1 Tax=Ruegeria sp. TaxID=1879320 RepID=UPI00230F9B6C|nr:extracellular solute-binding protein [Ruegeria sp.]MDA7966909.1 extracellular solute-binding protein [Ruegeria sp.]
MVLSLSASCLIGAVGGGFATGLPEDETVVTSHGLSVFGDLKYGPDFAHFDYVNPDAPKGGEISTWAFGTFDSLTPFILKGNSGALSTIFYDSLMTGGLDEPDALYGLVAESVEYPESRQWVIFNMRPEAEFRDGTPVTAEDVVFTFETLRDKGQPSYKLLFKDFEGAEALDTHRVKFTFKPDGALREAYLSAAGLPILSKAYYETRDFQETSLEAPMGSGAYTLHSVEPGRSITYMRRDDYWAKDLPVNVGQDNFDRIKVEYFADYTTAFEAFKAGAYTFREEFLSRLWATGYDFPALDKGWVKLETLSDGRPAGTQGFWFNLRRDKFSDPRVREAIGLAFNFEWSNQSLFHGLYTRTDSFWENSDMQAEGLPTAGELEFLEPLRGQIPDSVFTEPVFTPAESKPDAAGDRRALRKASKLLDEAGWAVGSDGLRRNAEGEVLSVEFLNDSPSFDRIILPFVDNLERLGIQAEAQRVDAAQAQQREKKFEYDVVVRRYAMSQTPGTELRGIFGSEAADIEGSSNVSGLRSDAVDSLIQKIESADNREDLKSAVRALDRVLRSQHIWVPQWYKPVHNIAYFDMYERPYTDNPPPGGIGELSIWWFNADKAAKLKAEGALR